ncbi:pseudouridine synthase [Salinispira pacifica]|uniref:Pseudouridine synthase n=1 Tax=Salinispira pacifica TaxID=1307761 RepID=V5WHR8_9SPIO|nr:pseudouridine synthase [Salinispira pacifica]AHC15165.1 Ribosomal large subunit pseudouridine synthase B [Salinispira pacifica]
MEQQEEPRLQVFLSRSGIASRRKSAELIEDGRVTVNGKVIREPGYRVQPADKVRFDGTSVSPEEEHLYLMLHKPARFISSAHDPEGRPTVMDLVQDSFSQRLFTIGRLDFMSTGLLLLTNDGDFAHSASHPRSGLIKQYTVETKEPIPRELLQEWLEGVRIKGVLYRLEKFQFINPRQVVLHLAEGKNREIRNVFSHGNLKVTRLHRTEFGPLKLGILKEGKFRQLSKAEVENLHREAKKQLRPAKSSPRKSSGSAGRKPGKPGKPGHPSKPGKSGPPEKTGKPGRSENRDGSSRTGRSPGAGRKKGRGGSK